MAPVLAVIIAVSSVAWTAFALISSDPPTTHSGAHDHDEAPTGAPTSPLAVSPTPLASATATPASGDVVDRCSERIAAAESAVNEAEIGAGHWSDHVQARTDLLVGLNTEAEARAIWKATRLAGPADIQRFSAALAAYKALPPCGDADVATAPESVRADAELCLRRAVSADAAVHAAEGVMGDWQGHLNAMAAHADGEMDAAEAQTTWVAAWKAAPTNIEAFKEAREALDQAPDCPGTLD